VLQQPNNYRLQIIYTQINRDKNNKPRFTHYYFHYDPQLYFNPASMVKMPLAFLALEKLQTLRKKGVDKNTTVQYDSNAKGQIRLLTDATAPDGKPTIGHFIKRAFLISENDPYNRLYQFVGQQTINRQLNKKGYNNSRITRQFMGFTPEQNRSTNGVDFLDKEGRLLYRQPPAYNTDSFQFPPPVLIGKAHYNRNDSLVPQPFDFTQHNAMSLGDLQCMLQAVLFSNSVRKKQRFSLSEDDYLFLYRYLSQYPSETPWPKYDSLKFYDSYVKFFFRDSTHRMPPDVRVFNKVGWAYGFVTDVSYVADFKNNVEYMLAATLYVNSDGILNDNKYDYQTIGYPFLYQLGQTIYKYEQERKRTFIPDLSRFKVTYEQRSKEDKRAEIKEVDN
jgi:hypothetical protein